MINTRVFTSAALLLLGLAMAAQKAPYTHADTLKGTYGKTRSWWDVLHYDLHVAFNINDSTIAGHNTITYKILEQANELQLDLMVPLAMDSIIQDGKKCSFRRDGNAFFVEVAEGAERGAIKNLTAYYHGRPVQARQAPWDGGVVWKRDNLNKPWISVACQGMAAQVWFPNKDHMADEPDSATVHFTAPDGLFVVSNGRFSGLLPHADGSATFSWKVRNPINNYNIIPYIGNYTVIKDTFNGRSGVLDIEFWFLQGNDGGAKTQFEQVKPMLRCFEDWFGPYPFYEDGYKLVEAPFLGMEHQSAIAYGNGFFNGYQGRDLSGTGWGLKWDFIIIHESGHEWFGNNISAADVADNWIHESFTAYSENLYTEYLYGKEAGAAYVIGTRKAVLNDRPIIADYNVNAGGSYDLYYKGANMLHTIRQIVNYDSIWKATLRGLNSEFRHKTVSSADIENYMIKFTGLDLQPVFDQYLRTTKIPVLEYKLRGNKLRYRWTNCVKNFNMPVKVYHEMDTLLLYPEKKWKKVSWKKSGVSTDSNFYVTDRAL